MNRFTYYTPLLAGFALAALMHDMIWERIGQGRFSENLHWAVVIIAGFLWGIQFQLLMLGSQGVFAQALPMPGGRTIRGGIAMLCGGCIWLATIAFFIARMVAEVQMYLAAGILGGIALLAAAGAILSYVWGWPTAARDFAGR